MNLITSFPQASGLTESCPSQRFRLQVVPLADAVAAVYFDSSDPMPLPNAHLSARTGLGEACLPLIATRLARGDGGFRSVFLFQQDARALCRDGLRILSQDRSIAEVDPMALQTPLVDPLALMVGLAPDGSQRLLRLLMTTGLSLFGKGSFDGFRDIITQLLEALSPPVMPMRSWCPLGQSGAMASYVMPDSLSPVKLTDLVVVGSEMAQPLPGIETRIEETGRQRLLHLFCPGTLPVGSTLVSLSDAPLRLAGPGASQMSRPFEPWLVRRSPQIRNWARGALARVAEQDIAAAALRTEIACPPRDRPEVEAHLLARTPNGLFYAISLRDPRRLVQSLLLRSHQGDLELPLAAPVHHRQLGPLQVGFVPAARTEEFTCDAHLHACYRSGRVSRIDAVSLSPMPATLPAFLDDMPPERIAAALGGALCDALPARPLPIADVLEVARCPVPAVLTVLVEISQSIDFPYALAASLQGRQDVTFVLHHEDRRAVPMLHAVADELHAVFGVGVGIVDLPLCDLLPAERFRAILSCVPSGATMALSEDTVPGDADWVETWTRYLDKPEPVLIGGNVRNHDGTALSQSVSPAHPVDRYAEPTHRSPSPAPLISASCFGLNASGRTALLSRPLRMPSIAGDISDLAQLCAGEGHAEISRAEDLRVTVFAKAPIRSKVTEAAERHIMASEGSA